MSNTKEVRILAEVPFDYLTWHHTSEGRLPDSEVAAIASALMSPSGGLTYEYVLGQARPNSHGGVTQMYGLLIGGREAMSWQFLRRLALALKNSGEFARVHIAEAMDVQWDDEIGRWENILDPAELSGLDRGIRSKPAVWEPAKTHFV